MGLYANSPFSDYNSPDPRDRRHARARLGTGGAAIAPQPHCLGGISDRDTWHRYVAVCALIIALCLALKLPSLFFPRAEYDERIYLSVAGNWLKNGSYSLQGTAVLRELPSSMYDKPLFHPFGSG